MQAERSVPSPARVIEALRVPARKRQFKASFRIISETLEYLSTVPKSVVWSVLSPISVRESFLPNGGLMILLSRRHKGVVQQHSVYCPRGTRIVFANWDGVELLLPTLGCGQLAVRVALPTDPATVRVHWHSEERTYLVKIERGMLPPTP